MSPSRPRRRLAGLLESVLVLVLAAALGPLLTPGSGALLARVDAGTSRASCGTKRAALGYHLDGQGRLAAVTVSGLGRECGRATLAVRLTGAGLDATVRGPLARGTTVLAIESPVDASALARVALSVVPEG